METVPRSLLEELTPWSPRVGESQPTKRWRDNTTPRTTGRGERRLPGANPRQPRHRLVPRTLLSFHGDDHPYEWGRSGDRRHYAGKCFHDERKGWRSGRRRSASRGRTPPRVGAATGRRPDPDTGSFERSDVGNAEFFARLYASELRFDHAGSTGWSGRGITGAVTTTASLPTGHQGGSRALPRCETIGTCRTAPWRPSSPFRARTATG